MRWSETDLVPISALQHYAYCPRQCALIHVERVWEENLHTVRGRLAHEHIDVPNAMVREGVRVEYALPVWSDRLGLVGRADVVEFQSDGTPYPVEHKVGPRMARRADEIQLCAQALCLEEMVHRSVPRGALYYRSSRRRHQIEFTASLRTDVERLISTVRATLAQTRLPPPVADARCRDCSLLERCLPYVHSAVAKLLERAAVD